MILRLLLGALAWLMACGSDGGSAKVDGGASGAVDDGALPETDAGRDSATDESDAGDASTPRLPTCNLVCDRVLDCATARCVGIGWQTARVAQGMCEDVCGPAFNHDVMAAVDCAAVMNVVTSAAPSLSALCNERPCASACDAFADCTKTECERYAPLTHEAIVQSCMGWCVDDNAGDILAVTCEDLIDSLDNDPSFAAGCHGTLGCADVDACTTYAEKTAACMSINCEGRTDEFETGIVAALIDYCAHAEDCPAPESIAIINGETVTCDDPPLDAVGPAAPFTSICAGTVGVSFSDLVSACQTLIDCGAELASAEACATGLTFAAGADTKANCINATIDCGGAFGCL